VIRPLRTVLLAALLAAPAVLAAADDPVAALIPGRTQPAVFNPRPAGGGWQVSPDERGYLEINDQAVQNHGALQVDNQWFQPTRQLQTTDGLELILVNDQNPAQVVVRRVRFDAKAGCVRWVDAVVNRSGAAASITLQITTGNNGPHLIATGEGGQTVNGTLAAGDGAVVVSQDPQWGGGSGSSLLVNLADPGAKVKPTVMNRGGWLGYSYQLQIPAGGVAAVVHTAVLRQQMVPAGPQLALQRGRAFLSDLPAALRRAIVNWKAGSGGADAMPAAIPEELVTARGDDADLLAIGGGTRLRGDAGATDLTAVIGSARHKVPWKDVLAVAGGSPGMLYLRDGSSVPADLAGGTVSFTLASGQILSLPLAKVGWLLRRPDGREGVPAGEALVEVDGRQRVVGAPVGGTMLAATLWGPLSLRMDDIAALRPSEDGAGAAIQLRDGSRFHAFLVGEAVRLRTRHTGERDIPIAAITAVAARSESAAEESDEDPGRGAPFAILAGGQQLIGTIDLPEIHLRLAGNRIPLPPQQIRVMTVQADEASRIARVRIELWSGDTAEGVLEEALLPLRTSAGVLRVPPADLSEYRQPVPALAPATRARITDLVAQLGDPEWGKREAASQALLRLGAVVRQPAQEALANANDPEVRARLERLLRELP
jgi:hypothetical protein